jgi:hypothetical protein
MGGSVRQILNWPGTYETYRKVPTAIVYYQAIPAEEAMSAKISQYSTYDCDPDLELAHAPKVDPDAEFPFQFARDSLRFACHRQFKPCSFTDQIWDHERQRPCEPARRTRKRSC